MIIAVIHWKIRSDADSIRQFLDKWRGMDPLDRKHYSGEFLSQPISQDEAGFLCTTLNVSSNVRYRSFFNIGIWKDLEAFRNDVIAPFVDRITTDLEDFEFDHRERMILAPFNWRAGTFPLPTEDNLHSPASG